MNICSHVAMVSSQLPQPTTPRSASLFLSLCLFSYLLYSRFLALSCLSPVSTTRVHGPSSRAKLTTLELGCHWLIVWLIDWLIDWLIYWFIGWLTDALMHPSSWAVNLARELGPWSWVVETGLYTLSPWTSLFCCPHHNFITIVLIPIF